MPNPRAPPGLGGLQGLHGGDEVLTGTAAVPKAAAVPVPSPCLEHWRPQVGGQPSPVPAQCSSPGDTGTVLSCSTWDVTVPDPQAPACHGAAAQATAEQGSRRRCPVSPQDPAARLGLGGVQGPTGTKILLGTGAVPSAGLEESLGGTPHPSSYGLALGSLPELIPGRKQRAGGEGLRGES